jgi:type III secretion protein U
MSDKTEEPTPRRLRKAREEGDSGASPYAAQALAFLVAVALAPSAILALASRASADLRAVLTGAALSHAPQFDPRDLATTVASLTLPVLVGAGIAAAVTHAVQTGGIIATKKLSLTLERLNPIAGIKGLFSATRLFAVVRALAAGILVGWLAWQGVSAHIVDFGRLVGRIVGIGAVVGAVAGSLAWRAALIGVAIGAVDVWVTQRAWLSKLRMTKGELRREHRDAEGDPQVKAARERAYQELIAQSTVANVRSATVVVINPVHLACALRYEDDNDGDSAPVVVANGHGDLAARILAEAHAHGVPVVRDAPLARALVELEPGQAIPEALYEAVAEILREAWSG